jgi:cytochrome c oxidase subunit 3
MSTHATNTSNAHYFVPHESHYSLPVALSATFMALGFILQLNKMAAGTWILIIAFSALIFMTFKWFAQVASESLGGRYSSWEDKSFRWGMYWFIFSEVMFFAAFFGALYYVRRIAVPELASYDPEFTLYPGYEGIWPTSGPKGPEFTPMGAWGIPAINTAILLTSGATLTWAHWALLKDNRTQTVLGLALTVLLGIVFMGFQGYEYMHAYNELGLTLGAGVYGATFFMLTGFHGFHVTLGMIMIFVVMIRTMKGHFSSQRHFGFEAVAWYWHFVDVVWLLLFVLVYWL